jgi:hypothetical protein
MREISSQPSGVLPVVQFCEIQAERLYAHLSKSSLIRPKAVKGERGFARRRGNFRETFPFGVGAQFFVGEEVGALLDAEVIAVLVLVEV